MSYVTKNTLNMIIKFCLELVKYVNDRVDEVLYSCSFSFIRSFFEEKMKILKKKTIQKSA